MDLTTDILDEIWEIADLTEEVELRPYVVASDSWEGAENFINVLALKRVRDDGQEDVGEDAKDTVRRRRWHLRAKNTDDAAWGPPKPQDLIAAGSEHWLILSVSLAAHNTRYVCETVRGQ